MPSNNANANANKSKRLKIKKGALGATREEQLAMAGQITNATVIEKAFDSSDMDIMVQVLTRSRHPVYSAAFVFNIQDNGDIELEVDPDTTDEQLAAISDLLA